MSSEIGASAWLEFRRGLCLLDMTIENIRFDQAGACKYDSNHWFVDMALTDFTPVNVPNPGYVLFKNLSQTTEVIIGYNDGGGALRDFATLDPKGGLAMFKIRAGRTIAAQAAADDTPVQYFVIER